MLYVKIDSLLYNLDLYLGCSSYIFQEGKITYQGVFCSQKACVHIHINSNRGL